MNITAVLVRVWRPAQPGLLHHQVRLQLRADEGVSIFIHQRRIQGEGGGGAVREGEFVPLQHDLSYIYFQESDVRIQQGVVERQRLRHQVHHGGALRVSTIGHR